MAKKPAAIQVALERSNENGTAKIVERWGIRAKLQPVPEGVLEDAERRIPDPPVPIVRDEEEGTEYENPNDPNYLRELQEANSKRGIASIEAMCLFGVELLDGLPEDDIWLKKLKFLEKRGHIDLSWVDWDDPMEAEFVFIRYAFLVMEDIAYLGLLSRMTEEELRRAAESFRR